MERTQESEKVICTKNLETILFNATRAIENVLFLWEKKDSVEQEEILVENYILYNMEMYQAIVLIP